MAKTTSKKSLSSNSVLSALKQFEKYKASQKRRRYEAYMSKKFPRAQYGRIYVPRGTPESLAAYGESRALANEQQLANRKRFGYTGRGAYGVRKFARDVGHLIPKKVGRALIDTAVEGIKMAPAAAMMYAGSGLYSGQGLYTGRGDYTYSANQLIDGGRSAPMFSAPNDETGGLVITHTEYLNDVFGASSAKFTCDGFNVNPGLLDNFPWLSQIAANFEEYEFIQLVYEFHTTVDASAVNNTNGSTGTIILAPLSNPSADNFSDKETMMQQFGAVAGRVVDKVVAMGVECDPVKNAGSPQKLVRSYPVTGTQDIKAYDHCKICIAQVNLPTTFQNQQIGELYVSYTVRLDKPRLFTTLGYNIPEMRWVSTPGTETNALVLGTPLQMTANFFPVALSQTAAQSFTLTFPDFMTGLYEVQFFSEGNIVNNTTGASAGATVTATISNSSTSGISFWSDLYGSSQFNTATLSGVGSTDNPGSMSLAVSSQFLNTTPSTIPGQIIFVSRLLLAPVTGGVDNIITYTFAGLTSWVPLQSQLIIRACNPGLKTSNSVPQPQYQTSSGIITSPY